MTRSSSSADCILIAAYILFMAGCAATSTTYRVAETSVLPLSFAISDMRDDREKRAELMSMLITDCWYGIYRIGDQQIVPDRIQSLASNLQSSLGPKLAGKTVSVKRFEIFNSSQAATRSSNTAGNFNPAAYGVSGSPGGWIAAGVVGALLQASTCESKLSPDKNPNNDPAIVIDVELIVDSVSVGGNLVQIEPKGREASLTSGDLTRERVRRALESTFAKLQEEVGKIVDK